MCKKVSEQEKQSLLVVVQCSAFWWSSDTSTCALLSDAQICKSQSSAILFHKELAEANTPESTIQVFMSFLQNITSAAHRFTLEVCYEVVLS